MRLLFLGDMVGKTGRTAVWERLPGLISDYKLDFVIVNGENAAGGFGITEQIHVDTIDAGADVVTTGNHVWDQKEAVGFAGRYDVISCAPPTIPPERPARLRPLHCPQWRARAGRQHHGPRLHAPGTRRPLQDRRSDPRRLPARRTGRRDHLDFHAEATSEKQCFGHFVDGRASLVVGTPHPCADRRPPDPQRRHGLYVGRRMCGDYDSSLGMEKEEPINRFISKMPKGSFEAANGPATVCGLAGGDFGPYGAGGEGRAAAAWSAAFRDCAGLLVRIAEHTLEF